MRRSKRKKRPARGDSRGPVILGRISGLYGVRGWVRVFSYTEPAEALLEYRQWLVRLQDAWVGMTLVEGRTQGKAVVAKITGVDDRDAAAGLLGADIAVARESLPETASGQYYWADLEGLEVRHRDGRLLGRIVRMLTTGAHDVMVLRPLDERANEGADEGPGEKGPGMKGRGRKGPGKKDPTKKGPGKKDPTSEILIPFVPEVYVLGVDLDAGRVDVDWEWD